MLWGSLGAFFTGDFFSVHCRSIQWSALSFKRSNLAIRHMRYSSLAEPERSLLLFGSSEFWEDIDQHDKFFARCLFPLLPLSPGTADFQPKGQRGLEGGRGEAQATNGLREGGDYPCSRQFVAASLSVSVFSCFFLQIPRFLVALQRLLARNSLLLIVLSDAYHGPCLSRVPRKYSSK